MGTVPDLPSPAQLRPFPLRTKAYFLLILDLPRFFTLLLTDSMNARKPSIAARGNGDASTLTCEPLWKWYGYVETGLQFLSGKLSYLKIVAAASITSQWKPNLSGSLCERFTSMKPSLIRKILSLWSMVMASVTMSANSTSAILRRSSMDGIRPSPEVS